MRSADELLALIEAEPGLEADLVVDPARPTTVKTRFVAGGQQLLRLDAEDPRPLDGLAETRLMAAAQTAISGAGVVLLSDYAKGVLTPDAIAACLAPPSPRVRRWWLTPRGAASPPTAPPI